MHLVERKFHQWTCGKRPVEARISVFERIRDIPYGLIPEINNGDNYNRILAFNKGSCTPKHLLLADMFARLGITVLLAVYPFRWNDVRIDFPPDLQPIIDILPDDHHMACKAEIEGRLVLVDATVDPALEKIGLPVNKFWDGFSDTQPVVDPSGEITLYHPLEAQYINSVMIDRAHLDFYARVNSWLDEVRKA